MERSVHYQVIYNGCLELLHNEEEARLTATFICEKHEGSYGLSCSPEWIYREVVGALVERHKKAISVIAYRQAKDVQLAEELIQLVNVKILTNLKQFRGKSKKDFFAWVNKMVHNAVTDFWREKQRNNLCPIDDAVALDNSNLIFNPSIQGLYVAEIVGRFTPRRQLILKGYYLDGIPYSELATNLGLSEATVRMESCRMLAEIREYFGVTPPRRKKKKG
jgi:RNA polymerase sigma factor (sigma-70 family)